METNSQLSNVAMVSAKLSEPQTCILRTLETAFRARVLAVSPPAFYAPDDLFFHTGRARKLREFVFRNEVYVARYAFHDYQNIDEDNLFNGIAVA